MSDESHRWGGMPWPEYLRKLAAEAFDASETQTVPYWGGVTLGVPPENRTAALEAELQIARELIAELSQRPTLDQWRELMAQAAATVVVPVGDEKGAFPARALAFQRQAVGLLTEKPA